MSADVTRDIEAGLGHRFVRPQHLARALTHRSAGAAINNETLEFLGDAVLDLAISDLLMRRFPDAREGELSKMRAGLVNAATLAAKAGALGLAGGLVLGKGEEKTGGREKESILAAAYEAVLGAVYVDAGYDAARAAVEGHFAADVAEAIDPGAADFKTRLQERTQRELRASPIYELVDEQGPDHDKRFVVELTIVGRVFGRGVGTSKKAAEQAAAMEALGRLDAESVTVKP
jgi:ribonuclease-3